MSTDRSITTPHESPDDLLTLYEAADLIGRSYTLIEILLKEGRLHQTLVLRRGQSTRLVRRADLLACDAAMRARMTIAEVRDALHLKSVEDVHRLVRSGKLTAHPPLPHRGHGTTFERDEVENLANADKRRLTSREAVARAGADGLSTFKTCLKRVGGAPVMYGKQVLYEVEQVEAVRRALHPESSITVADAAKILEVTTEQVRAWARSGELAAIVRPTSEAALQGWRFDLEDVRAFKWQRDRVPLVKLLDAWPFKADRPADRVERTGDGSVIHTARLQGDGASPMGLAFSWATW